MIYEVNIVNNEWHEELFRMAIGLTRLDFAENRLTNLFYFSDPTGVTKNKANTIITSVLDYLLSRILSTISFKASNNRQQGQVFVAVIQV